MRALATIALLAACKPTPRPVAPAPIDAAISDACVMPTCLFDENGWPIGVTHPLRAEAAVGLMLDGGDPRFRDHPSTPPSPDEYEPDPDAGVELGAGP